MLYIIKACRLDGEGTRLVDVPVKNQGDASGTEAIVNSLANDNTIASIRISPQFGRRYRFARGPAKQMFPDAYNFEYIPNAISAIKKYEQKVIKEVEMRRKMIEE